MWLYIGRLANRPLPYNICAACLIGSAVKQVEAENLWGTSER